MADMEAILYSKLSGTAGVTALVSTRIYPSVAPQDVSLPYVLYRRISSVPVNHAAPGYSGEMYARVRVECCATTYAGAKSLSEAVRNALNGWRDTGTSPKIQSALHIGEFDAPETIDTGGQEAVHVASLDFSIWFSA